MMDIIIVKIDLRQPANDNAVQLRCRPQVYGFSLNISKGSTDSGVVYGLLRSAATTVQVDVSANSTSEPERCND